MSGYQPHQRGALTLIALLLLLFGVFAADELVPQRISRADFYIYNTYVVSSTSGLVSDLRLNVSIPLDGVLTQVPPGASRVSDSDGNSFLSIRQDNPPMPYFFTYNLSVHTEFRPLANLPSAGPLPRSLGSYLISTPAMPASDPAIKGLAANITAQGRTDFEKTALLAQWVHDYITYDVSAASPSPDVRTILATRRGVCTEYSVLFVTLARSLGYPTRFVSGYAYASTLGVWQAHSWAEVWLGEWVPVDPTWLEVGSVDPTHIILSRSAFADFETVSVSGMVQEPGQLILNGDKPLGSIADNVHLVSMDPAPAESRYGLSASASTLPSGGRALIWMSYAASDYRIMSLQLAPCRSESGPLITLVSADQQRLIAEPGRTYNVIWLVQAAPQLNPNYIYRCPLTLNSEYLGLKSASLSLRDDLGRPWPILSADLERTSLLLGGKQTVFVRMPPAMAGEAVHLLEPTLLLNASLSGAGSAKFEFTPDEPGNHTLYIFSSRGDPLALSYFVLTAPAPAITSASANQSLIEGDAAELLVELDDLDTGTAARPFTLDWSGNGASGQENVSSGSSQSLRIPLRPTMSGDFIFSLRLIAADGTEIARRILPLKVWPAGDVAFVSLQPQSQTNSGWQVLLQFTASNEARHPQLLVGGTTWDIPSDGRLVVSIEDGRQPAVLSWQDLMGATHRKDIVLEVKPTEAKPRLPSSTNSSLPMAGPYSSSKNILLPAVLVVLFFGALFGGTLYFHIRELHALYRSDSQVGKEAGGFEKDETGRRQPPPSAGV